MFKWPSTHSSVYPSIPTHSSSFHFITHVLTPPFGFPDGSVVKNPPANAGAAGSIPGSGRSPWSRKWQRPPVFFPGKFHGQRSLRGCGPWGHKELDTTEHTAMHTHSQLYEEPTMCQALSVILIEVCISFYIWSRELAMLFKTLLRCDPDSDLGPPQLCMGPPLPPLPVPGILPTVPCEEAGLPATHSIHTPVCVPLSCDTVKSPGLCSVS